jgi:hypothetical protein
MRTRFAFALVVVAVVCGAPNATPVGAQTSRAEGFPATQQPRLRTVAPAAAKLAPFKPILKKKVPSFSLTGPGDPALLGRAGALSPAKMGKLFKKQPLRRGGPPLAPHPPAPPPPGPACPCAVTLGLSPVRADHVYFTDEPLTASYRVDCATEVVVGQMKHTDYRQALAAAEKGQTIDDGGGSGLVVPDTSPQWPGILSGSRSMAGSAPGVYSWYIGASNRQDGSQCSQLVAFQLIARPATATPCAPYQGCIDKMVRYIKPRIAPGVTGNAALDSQVEAFRDKVYDRQVIGLRLEQDLLATGNITCISTCAGTSYTPPTVTLDFCPNAYPTDYALLHELVHRAGFDDRLIAAYTAKGLAAPTHTQVEQMAAQVAGAPFDVSRTCTQY